MLFYFLKNYCKNEILKYKIKPILIKNYFQLFYGILSTENGVDIPEAPLSTQLPKVPLELTGHL